MTNCVCTRKRRIAREVAQKLRASLVTSKDWKVEQGALRLGEWRVYECGKVYFRGCQMWFPLLQRLCVRSAVRYRMSLEALRSL